MYVKLSRVSMYWQVLISVTVQDIMDLFTVRSASYICIVYTSIYLIPISIDFLFSFVTTAGVLTAFLISL